MVTSFPPLILGSSHAFLKNASDQPSESISLSEKNYPRSYPLKILNPWQGLNKDELTTRCVLDSCSRLVWAANLLRLSWTDSLSI